MSPNIAFIMMVSTIPFLCSEPDSWFKTIAGLIFGLEGHGGCWHKVALERQPS